jgi:hypothetical protein
LEERLSLYEGSSNVGEGVSRLYNTDVFATRRTTNKPDDDMARALRGVNQLTLATRLPEFYGGSSPNVILDVVESGEDPQHEYLDDSPNPRSPENRATLWLGGPQLSFGKACGASLPPKATIDEYIDRYFQTAHRIFPILNKQLLVDTYTDYSNGLPTEGRGYENWTAVLYMVIALGHQYSLIDADEEVRAKASASPEDGETCFRLAKSTLPDVAFVGGDVSAVNSLLLAVSEQSSRFDTPG